MDLCAGTGPILFMQPYNLHYEGSIAEWSMVIL
jgi:hypothetical protein